MALIDVENLVSEYPGKRALYDVSFTIDAGSITALVGPNGAGKTTLLRCIAALDAPFSGTVRVDGVNVVDEPRRVHRQLGYLSDFFGLYDELSVRQCLEYAARLHSLSEAQIASHIAWAGELLELTGQFSSLAGSLSRGWRQRLGIAQAIIRKPPLLLLDEPASGLDPEARIGLSALFRTLQRQGMTLIVSSHILAELEDYCTDMLILRDGRVAEHRKSVHQAADIRLLQIGFLSAPARFLANLKTHPQVKSVRVSEDSLQLEFTGGERDQHLLLASLIAQGADIVHFSPQQHRLQDVYLSSSKKEPRV